MTIFGTRDFERSPEATVARDTGNGQQAAVVSLPVTTTKNPESRRILMRLHGGEDIVVGHAEGREAGVRLAREMIRHIDEAEASGEWPELEDRFIRPGAIVSVDVQRTDE